MAAVTMQQGACVPSKVPFDNCFLKALALTPIVGPMISMAAGSRLDTAIAQTGDKQRQIQCLDVKNQYLTLDTVHQWMLIAGFVGLLVVGALNPILGAVGILLLLAGTACSVSGIDSNNRNIQQLRSELYRPRITS